MNLLEHQEITIQLLKQIKIANKTGENTVPPAICKIKDFYFDKPNRWTMQFSIENSEYRYLTIATTIDGADIYFESPYDNKKSSHIVYAHNTKFYRFAIKFFSVNYGGELEEAFTPWAKYLKYPETKKILIQEARRQAQQQNWPFL